MTLTLCLFSLTLFVPTILTNVAIWNNPQRISLPVNIRRVICVVYNPFTRCRSRHFVVKISMVKMWMTSQYCSYICVYFMSKYSQCIDFQHNLIVLKISTAYNLQNKIICIKNLLIFSVLSASVLQ